MTVYTMYSKQDSGVICHLPSARAIIFGSFFLENEMSIFGRREGKREKGKGKKDDFPNTTLQKKLPNAPQANNAGL